MPSPLDKLLIIMGLKKSRGPITSLRARLIRGMSWTVVGTGLSEGLAVVAAVVVARLLGSEQYGELSILRSSAGLFGVLAGFGLGLAGTKFVAEFRDRDPARAGRLWGVIDSFALLSCAAAAALLVALAPLLAERVLGAARLTNLLRLTAVLLAFSTLMGIQNGVLAGFEAFRQIALVGLFRGLINFPIMIGLTWWFGLPGAVVGLGLVALGGYAIGWVYVRRQAAGHGVRLTRSLSPRGVGFVLRFTLPVLASSLLIGGGQWACHAIMVRQPGGFAQLGLFDAANRWIALVGFVAMTMAQPALSLLANTYGRRDYVEFRKVLADNLKITVGGTVLVAWAVAAAAPWIMRPYGPEFTGSVVVLQVLCGMVVLRSASRVATQVLISIGRVRTELLLGLLIIVPLLGAWLLLLDYGALGLALAHVISFAVHLPLTGAYVVALVGSMRREWLAVPAEPVRRI